MDKLCQVCGQIHFEGCSDSNFADHDLDGRLIAALSRESDLEIEVVRLKKLILWCWYNTDPHTNVIGLDQYDAIKDIVAELQEKG